MKRFLFTVAAIVSLALCAAAQDAEHSKEGAAPEVLTYAEQMPEPTINLSKFLAKNLRYPEAARKQNVEGKVTVGFVVDTIGQVKDVTVVRSVDALLDSESVRVIRLMPRWKPGMQDGRVVTVYKTLPISFRINEHQLMELAKPTDGDIFKYVDKEPKPTFDLDSFISANLHFPEPEKTTGMYGTVLVKIQINEDGSVSNPLIAGSVYPTLDKEAMRVLSLMPAWEPALIDNKPVGVFMPVKVQFKQDQNGLDVSLKRLIKNIVNVDQMPEPGFDINRYLSNNLKYPKEAKRFNIEGREYVIFVIDEEGNVTNVFTPNPVSVFLDLEARRVVENMPKWEKAGIVKNKPVKVYYTLPIVFRLEK